jgi:hypothetical protein
MASAYQRDTFSTTNLEAILARKGRVGKPIFSYSSNALVENRNSC